MITLNNIIQNSNFETLEYTESNSIKSAVWTNVYTYNHSYIYNSKNVDENKREIVASSINCGILDSKYSYSGTYSLLFNRNNATVTSNKFSIIKNHQYYLSCYTFTPNSSKTSESINFKIYRHNNSLLDLNFTNTWTHNSHVFTAKYNTNNSSYINMQTEFNDNDTNPNLYIDAVMLIDLTEAFGEYGEPSKEWCDKHIPYFENQFEINPSKDVQILNIRDFVRDETTNICYNNNEIVKLIFSIKDFDLERNKTVEDSLKTKIMLIESYEDDSDIDDKITQIYFGDERFNESKIISIQNNTAIFEITLNCDTKSVTKQFQIIGDNALYGNTLTTYCIFNWRSTNAYNILTCELDEMVLDSDNENNIIYYSEYTKTIKGETNPYIYSPTKINVFINGTKLSNVEFIKNNYHNCTYNKELHFIDGNNKLTIQTVDIFGNIIKEINCIINVNILLESPDSVNLLTNFIGNDDQMIELKMDDARLSYVDKNAGNNKNINIDTSVTPRFFNLEGINSQYYRISRDNLPEIKGDIVKKPIVINFDGIEKIYDGTSDVTNIMNMLSNNNGYKFIDTNEQYTSYLKSGFVKGSFENLYMQTNIFNREDILPETYVVHSNNIDLSSFHINIDGYEGLPILDNTIINPTKIDFVFKEIEDKQKNITKITLKKHYLDLINKKDLTGLFYHIYQITKLDGTKVFCGCAIYSHIVNDNIELKQHEILTEDTSIYSLDSLETELKHWLKAIDNIIYGASLELNEKNQYILTFHSVNTTDNYKVKDRVTIKYNYKINSSNNDSYTFKDSDVNKVTVTLDNAHFNTKNVTSEWQPITCTGLVLSKGTLGDESNNYQIANYSAYGRIVKRGVTAHIKCLDKIYDGTQYVPFEFNSDFYNGLENVIKGDDVWIDDTYYGLPLDNFHTFKKTGATYLEFFDSDVGNNKVVKPINNAILEGKDAINYYLEGINCNYNATIYSRQIEVVIDKLRFITSTHKWEISYHFINDISTDNLTLAFNKDDNYDFKVYGGVSIPEGNNTNTYEIHTLNDLSNVKDIISMYFKNDNQYYRQFIISDTASYYESINKDYKLYNQHKVKVTNLNLDPTNPKSKNYTLMNTEFETTLEII